MDRQADGCRLIISGHVANTEDLSRIEDVELDSDVFDEAVTTDEDGNFRVDLSFDADEDPDVVEVEISADGFLTKTVEVDFSKLLENCVFLTEVEWHIALSPKKPVIALSTTNPTSATINDQFAVVTYEENEALELVPVDTTIVARSYSITFPAVTSINEPSVCVSPSHCYARGAGIVLDEDSQELSLIDFVVDASSNIALNGAIQLTFSTPYPIGNGDVINVNNGSIVNFDVATGTLTLLITSLENIEVVNTFGCSIEAVSTTTGQQRSRQSLSNCNCGDAQEFTFFSPFDPFTTLTLDVPEGTSQLQNDLLTEALFNCLNLGIANEEEDGSVVDFASGVSVVADKCQVVTLESRNIIRTYRGEILGVPFTYRVSAETETGLTTGVCPTTTACHQGCPG
ncbi:MAG: hypothetical protein AB8G22_10665 [Saprospiraceae bacterium]